MNKKNKPDLSKVRVEVRWHEDMWQEVKNATMTTIGKDTGKYPDTDWKRKLLMAEHSPIRIPHIIVKVYDAPQFVHGHLVRHSLGATPFVSTLRSDRNDYDEVPNRNTLQSAEYIFNFQAFINISRKRCCTCASYETRFVWNKVLEAFKELEPELHGVCVKECVYRNGMCPEMFTCGYNKTKAFKEELKNYTEFIQGQICDETNIWNEINFTQEEKTILLELLINEQIKHLIPNDEYESERYSKLEELKVKIRD